LGSTSNQKPEKCHVQNESVDEKLKRHAPDDGGNSCAAAFRGTFANLRNIMVAFVCRRRIFKVLEAAAIMVAALFSTASIAQTAYGSLFWDCQTNMTEGGPGTTQLQAAAN
jgi:hypothetical protein